MHSLTEGDARELIALRRHLHARPELSLQERETARYIESYLLSLGLSPVRIGDHGITATVYARQPGCKTAAIRAEMDAIPVQEQLDVPWKSRNPGVMHACGHDAILASALMLAKLCSEHRDALKVNVKFLFQPAEENGKGTALMLDGGAMTDPKVDYFLMYHFVNDAPSGLELQRAPPPPPSALWSLPSMGKPATGVPVSWVWIPSVPPERYCRSSRTSTAPTPLTAPSFSVSAPLPAVP